MTDSDIDRFHLDGAICIRDGVPAVLVALLRRAISKWLIDEHSNVNLVREHAGASSLRVAMNLWSRSPLFEKVAFDAGLASIAARLLGSREVFLFNDNLFVKDAGANVPLDWHNDLPYYPIDGTMLLTLWLPVDHVDLWSGGLRYVAGSHGWGQRYRPVHFTPGSGTYDLPFPVAPDIENAIDTYRILTWDVLPGDVIAHHGLTLHSSGPNRSSHQRRALALRFAGDDITWAPRANTLVVAEDPGLTPGDRIGGPSFPRVWPAATAATDMRSGFPPSRRT
ncbi:MAG TPA: phytanoyl-CoA dioxygenase family protein [Acidimicrobiales bacterium]